VIKEEASEIMNQSKHCSRGRNVHSGNIERARSHCSLQGLYTHISPRCYMSWVEDC